MSAENTVRFKEQKLLLQQKPKPQEVTIVPPSQVTKEEKLDASIMSNSIKVNRSFEEAGVATTSLMGRYAEMYMNWYNSFFPLAPKIDDNPYLKHIKYIKEAGDAARIFMKNGEKIGVTPKEEVASLGPTKLFHYKAPKEYDPDVSKELFERRKGKDLFVLFARMNDKDIYDLSKGKSYIEHMLKQGYSSIYILQWGEVKKGEPGWEKYKNTNFEDDVLVTMPHMIKEMQKHSGNNKFLMQGWCQGSALALMYASLQPELWPDSGLEKVVSLTPPLKHSPEDKDPLTVMVREHASELPALVAANDGVMPGEIIDTAVKYRDSWNYVVAPYIAAFEAVRKGDQRTIKSMKEMQVWMKSLTSLPGEWYLRYIREMYNNNLVEGRIVLTDPKTGEGHRVDLKNVNVPTLFVGADKDDITPPSQWAEAPKWINGAEVIINPGGHVGLMISGKAKDTTWKGIREFIDRDAGTLPKQNSIFQIKPPARQVA